MAAKSDCMRKSKLGDALDDADSGNVSRENNEGLENVVAYAQLVGGSKSGDLGGRKEARRTAAKSVHAGPAERGRWAVLMAAAAARDSSGESNLLRDNL